VAQSGLGQLGHLGHRSLHRRRLSQRHAGLRRELDGRARGPHTHRCGFEESVFGGPINARDSDTNDSIPVFARFDLSDPNDFDFPGPAIAVDADNAGMVIANGTGFYRVEEAATTSTGTTTATRTTASCSAPICRRSATPSS
jgi:hypothetical protein